MSNSSAPSALLGSPSGVNSWWSGSTWWSQNAHSSPGPFAIRQRVSNQPYFWPNFLKTVASVRSRP